MANADRPSGASPQGEILRARKYIAGARVFPGDFVTLESDGKVDPAAASEALLGVAISYADADLSEVLVADHPDQLFEVQASGSDIDAQTDVGVNYNILATAGNTTYNQSRMELNSASGNATDADLPLQLLGVVDAPSNELGAQVKCVVRINNHQLQSGTGRQGV